MLNSRWLEHSSFQDWGQIVLLSSETSKNFSYAFPFRVLGLSKLEVSYYSNQRQTNDHSNCI